MAAIANDAYSERLFVSTRELCILIRSLHRENMFVIAQSLPFCASSCPGHDFPLAKLVEAGKVEGFQLLSTLPPAGRRYTKEN